MKASECAGLIRVQSRSYVEAATATQSIQLDVVRRGPSFMVQATSVVTVSDVLRNSLGSSALEQDWRGSGGIGDGPADVSFDSMERSH